MWREGHTSFEVEDAKVVHPNVMTFKLETGGQSYYVVGAYLPPGDLEALEHVRDALDRNPSGATPILLGDLNANLGTPLTERDKAITDVIDGNALEDAKGYFRVRRRGRLRGGRSWRRRWS